MTRIRTHNKRAKRIGYAKFFRIRRNARKVARYATMYGMGAQKMSEALEAANRVSGGMFNHSHVYDLMSGTISGRMVSRGPEPQYLLPKPRSFQKSSPVFLTNYAEQERRALAWHRQSLDAAREAGHTVIEHTYADATVLVKEDKL